MTKPSSISKTKKAFTLVELSLAMAFLAVLLITIALLVIHLITIYQKGLVLRTISSTGRQLIDDFTRSISIAPLSDIAYKPAVDDQETYPTDPNRTTYRYYFQKLGTAAVGSSGELRPDVPLAGALCTGAYSYLWNTAYALADQEDFAGFTYTYDSDPSKEVYAPVTTGSDGLPHFKLIRLTDKTRSICIDQRQDTDGLIDYQFSGVSANNFSDPSLPGAASASLSTQAPIELLATSEDELALYDLRVFPISHSQITGHSLYSATFILATLRGGVDIFANGNFCTVETSNTLNTDFNYCAINKFNFTMRATGEGDNKSDEYGQREENKS